MNDLNEVNTGSAGTMKPKFPVGTSVKVKRVKADTIHDDDGETNGSGVYNTYNMIRYQGLVYRVSDIIRRNLDDKSYWVYMFEGSIYYYAESMIHPIERKEVFL